MRVQHEEPGAPRVQHAVALFPQHALAHVDFFGLLLDRDEPERRAALALPKRIILAVREQGVNLGQRDGTSLARVQVLEGDGAALCELEPVILIGARRGPVWSKSSVQFSSVPSALFPFRCTSPPF